MNCSINLGVKAEASLRKGYQWPYKVDKVRSVSWPKDLLTVLQLIRVRKNDLDPRKFKAINYIKQNDIIRLISNFQEEK